ncbi:nuclease-related domain-containing protein [Butyrivibrio fibrisolvens]|uniref:nuclease-related domain-containing protein n=1 Tax=Butyrivibrio fibrisolvens TaxID=831 RepID=UPI0012BD0277|nr:nuclease-related domain-containing protein [Butyrivibrio fibrisolvens]
MEKQNLKLKVKNEDVLKDKNNASALQKTLNLLFLIPKYKDFINRKIYENSEFNFDLAEKYLGILGNSKAMVSEYTYKDLIDINTGNELKDKLLELIVLLKEEISKETIALRAREYGHIATLKRELRDEIFLYDFKGLYDLFIDYKKKESEFENRKIGLRDEIKASYDPYVKFYHFASVMISERMDFINKKKPPKKHFADEEIQEALCYIYDTNNAQQAMELYRIDRYREAKKSGNEGEKRVDYSLRWLDSSYVKIEHRSKNICGDPCILLHNSDFFDQTQEFDQIIISNVGIFLIEIKNLKGVIIVDKNSNWIRIKNRDRVGMRNPLEQVRRHEKIVKSFLPNSIPVFSIVCIANDNAILEGEGLEKLPFKIVKSDSLVEFIESVNRDFAPISEAEKNIAISEIYSHMVSSNTKESVSISSDVKEDESLEKDYFQNNICDDDSAQYSKYFDFAIEELGKLSCFYACDLLAKGTFSA